MPVLYPAAPATPRSRQEALAVIERLEGWPAATLGPVEDASDEQVRREADAQMEYLMCVDF